MFEVKVYVEERKLGAFLWACDGVILGKPEVTPVRGATAKNGRAVATNKGSTSATLAAMVKESKKKTVTTPELREMIKKAGGSPAGKSVYIASLQRAGILGRNITAGNRRTLAKYPIVAKGKK